MKLQKKLAASLSGVSESRVKIDLEKLDELGGSVDDLKQSITKNDVRSYINSGVIIIRPKRGTSRGRARKLMIQKRKGRRRGPGSRKGKANARFPAKQEWMNRIRKQRSFLKEIKDKEEITPNMFRQLYRKAKGGFFRSKRHIKLYLEEHGLSKHGKD
ncbi:MAG: 50S ribosomal protein L19e [Nanoarchaeota archaeon]|nr:50S ribosomal protein L19e [Nanoarchaeota archaeon]